VQSISHNLPGIAPRYLSPASFAHLSPSGWISQQSQNGLRHLTEHCIISTPQVTLFGAVTRIIFSNQTHEPDQAMTVEGALRAHAMGSAPTEFV
jgi:hypothetical protein